MFKNLDMTLTMKQQPGPFYTVEDHLVDKFNNVLSRNFVSHTGHYAALTLTYWDRDAVIVVSLRHDLFS